LVIILFRYVKLRLQSKVRTHRRETCRHRRHFDIRCRRRKPASSTDACSHLICYCWSRYVIKLWRRWPVWCWYCTAVVVV